MRSCRPRSWRICRRRINSRSSPPAGGRLRQAARRRRPCRTRATVSPPFRRLIAAISAPRDQKGILDLQARITAELGMLQNEQTKLRFSLRRAKPSLQRMRSGSVSMSSRAGPIRDPLSAGAVTAMGFFATFWSWLNGQLGDLHRQQHGASWRQCSSPPCVTLAVLYVMAWGYLHLTGQIEEPFVAGLKRIVMLAVDPRRRSAPLALQHGDRRHLLQRARAARGRGRRRRRSGRNHRCHLGQRRDGGGKSLDEGQLIDVDSASCSPAPWFGA